MFKRRDMAARVMVAKSVALNPRTIIAHTSHDGIVICTVELTLLTCLWLAFDLKKGHPERV